MKNITGTRLNKKDSVLQMDQPSYTMDQPSYSLRQLVLYFLKLGTIGFGGPVALVGYVLALGFAYVKAGGMPWSFS